jgi:ankyrin repeat protein
MEAKTNYGLTPLHCACESGEAELVRLLLDRGADLEAKTCKGDKALHFVSMDDKKLSVARLLIRKGAEMEATTSYRVTPLILALLSRTSKMVQLLLDSGADFETKIGPGGSCNYPFHVACDRGPTRDCLAVYKQTSRAHFAARIMSDQHDSLALLLDTL